MDSSPLLSRLGRILEADQAKQEEELFRTAVKVMPTVMLQVLEEVRGIPDAAILSLDYVIHYHQPEPKPIAHFNVEGHFTQFEYKGPTPEMVLRCRIYINERRTVRTVMVSSMGMAKLNELKAHLDCDTTLDTYIGPYPYANNSILKAGKDAKP